MVGRGEMDDFGNNVKPVRPIIHTTLRGNSHHDRNHSRFIIHLLLIVTLFGAMGCISDIDHIWAEQERAFHFLFVLIGWFITCTYIALAGGYMGIRMVMNMNTRKEM